MQPYPPPPPPPAPALALAPAPQTRPPRKLANRILAGLVALLVLALIGNLVAVAVVRGDLRKDVSALQADATARKQAQDRAKAALTEEFRKADLSGKLQRVRDLSTAATQALLDWGRNPQNSGIKNVRRARNICFEAVIEYDTTAARFPPEMLGGLPRAIDTKDNATACGR